MAGEHLIIRSATLSDAPAIASAHVAAWRETYSNLLPSAVLSGLSNEDRTQRWEAILDSFDEADAGAAFVAILCGEVNGFVSVGRQRDQELAARGFGAEVTAIYVLARAQRKGIGRALIRAAAGHVVSFGYNAATLWVLEANSNARRFYEALGARPLAERENIPSTTALSEIAYGWDNLSLLL